MSQQNLVDRLRREIKRDPKKAGALGLMFLVAIYFWAPLVSGWMGSSRPADMPPTASTATTPTVPATTENTTAAKPTNEAKPVSWQELIAWQDEDPRRAPATLVASRDPFHAVEKVVEQKPVDEKPEKKIEAKSMDQVGLVLSSTLVGPRSSLARINGKTYHTGQAVRVQYEGERVAFQVKEIHPRRVVLERDGTRFELKSGRSNANEEPESDNEQ